MQIPRSYNARPAFSLDELPPDIKEDVMSHYHGRYEQSGTYPTPPYWQCFHCGEKFRTYEGARIHFGPGEPVQRRPLCLEQ